jgi:hypothetical protein
MAPKHLFPRLKVIVLLILCLLIINPLPLGLAASTTEELATPQTACRLGVDSPLGRGDYDIASLRVASYLDWGAVNNPSLPDGTEYIRVLRLRDNLYPATFASLPAWVAANPGSVWVVGNEPDTTYNNQDGLTPETYADRYYTLATIIRGLDRTAQIAFGTIVQPTPIRMRYLLRAWNRLVVDTGSAAAASALIDIWSIHSFILNEVDGQWGTGVPPGFTSDHADAVVITDYADTHSIQIFQERIVAFRLWMAGLGERNKPLWITEYGSLFPPVDPIGGPDYANVTDYDTALFMWNTFDFLLLASDQRSGMPADGNQLVQRWFWFSLNEHRYTYGGSIYNPDYPDYGPRTTLVGLNFLAYQDLKLVQPDLLPTALSITPIAINDDPSLVDYKLQVTVDNTAFADATCAQLWLYDGDPDDDGTLIAGPLPSSAFHPNYGQALVTTYWLGAQPLTDHQVCVLVGSIGVDDLHLGNNKACFSVHLEQPQFIFLPVILRR